MPLGPLPTTPNNALAKIPVVVAKEGVAEKRRFLAPPARSAVEPYRAYKPLPFTREERVMQSALENLGYRMQILPTATRDDLLTGREVADIGQCCRTAGPGQGHHRRVAKRLPDSRRSEASVEHAQRSVYILPLHYRPLRKARAIKKESKPAF